MIEMVKDQWELFRRPKAVEEFGEMPNVMRLIVLRAYKSMKAEHANADDLVWFGIACYEHLEQETCKVYGDDQQTMRAFVRAWLWLNQRHLLGWYTGKSEE